MVSILGLTVLLLAAAPLCYYLLALYCVVDFFREPAPRLGRADGLLRAEHGRTAPGCSSENLPPVSILKPVCGADRDAYENFASFCRLDYPEYELVFGAASPADSAIAIIRRLQQDFPAYGSLRRFPRWGVIARSAYSAAWWKRRRTN